MSVRPKLSTRGSDSLPTGRSSTLYESSRSFSSFFSWRPPLTSPVPNHNQQSVRSCAQSVATISLVLVDVASPRFGVNARNGERDNAGMTTSLSLFLSLSLSVPRGVRATFIFLGPRESRPTLSTLPIPSLL